jgi:hypothetical protein
MNTEDDEFNRIETESKARKMAVEYALQKLHDENVRLGLYDGVYDKKESETKDEKKE